MMDRCPVRIKDVQLLFGHIHEIPGELLEGRKLTPLTLQIVWDYVERNGGCQVATREALANGDVQPMGNDRGSQYALVHTPVGNYSLRLRQV